MSLLYFFMKCPLALLAAFFVYSVQAQISSQCNICLKNNVACVDSNRYSICNNGEISSIVVTCPSGRVCTDSSGICVTPSETTSAACVINNCENCAVTGNRFACLSETDYAFCYRSDTPDMNSKTPCPTGYYCDVENFDVCTKISAAAAANPSCLPASPTTTTSTTEASTTLSSSSSTSTSPTPTVTSTTEQPFDADVFCEGKTTGNFAIGSECKNYVYCYKLSGQYLGLTFTCEAYFNSSTRKCQTQKPENC